MTGLLKLDAENQVETTKDNTLLISALVFIILLLSAALVTLIYLLKGQSNKAKKNYGQKMNNNTIESLDV